MRKFERTTQNKDGKLPKRSTKNSAGYDFFANKDTTIRPGETKIISTGIKAYMEKGEVLIIANRSGNPIKKNLVLANGIGIIDSDYADNPDNEGEIGFLFTNISEDQDVNIEKGEKLGQGVFVKYLVTDDDMAEGNRSGGFGSTGK